MCTSAFGFGFCPPNFVVTDRVFPFASGVQGLNVRALVWSLGASGRARMSTDFVLHKPFEHPLKSGTSQQNSRHIPDSLPSKPKENKLSREGANFSTPTPSCGRPSPHPPAASGPKQLISVFFCLASESA